LNTIYHNCFAAVDDVLSGFSSAIAANLQLLLLMLALLLLHLLLPLHW
jgi:hypothetical protein